MAWVVDMVSDGRYIVLKPLLEVVDCTVVYEDLEPISVIANCDCGVPANEFPFKSNVLSSLCPTRSLITMSVKQTKSQDEKRYEGQCLHCYCEDRSMYLHH